MNEVLRAQRGGAKALLLTVLGEFVLPAGGSVWTSSLVAAADAVGIAEKNARQAVARIGDRGLIESSRHGRTVRWSLTAEGRRLLESGTARIYGFGNGAVHWHSEWLVAHCPVSESQRTLRNQLRTQLGFLGFGELSPSLLVSPHVERESQLRDVLREMDLLSDSTIMRSTTGTPDESSALVKRAWSLDQLADFYVDFSRSHEAQEPANARAKFRAVVELVHDWRRFPFIDPELPTELLPDQWAGALAAKVFHARHMAWSDGAQRWFADQEALVTPR
ncbi:MAG: PaaX family transcriptional regulator [Acidimicrobiales bacterium]